MIRVLRDFRLLPLVLLATVSLLVLKTFGLLFDGGYVLAPPAHEESSALATPGSDGSDDIVGSIAKPAEPEPTMPEIPPVTAPMMPAVRAGPGTAIRQSWAQEMFSYPDITGSVGGGKKEAATAKPGPTKIRKENAPGPKGQTAARSGPDKSAAAPEQQGAVSPSERAILERLQERRKDLEVRARELDMREALLKAAEKRLEGRVGDLKQVEERIKVAQDKKGDVADARFKGLVAMYENMKAKDAARIFDRLDLKILANLAGQINPRRMADILANMSSEAAERLTIEFASHGDAQKPRMASELPKIEGRPNPGP